jgi:16S rRNA (adenine1518-N6/adenine1519-N6)-dimethyltransferase
MVLMVKGIAAMFLTPRQYFRRQGSQPRKRFGQHFLEQTATARGSCKRRPHCLRWVVEVARRVALTQFIPGDVGRTAFGGTGSRLAEYLGGCLESTSARVHIHRQDVLTLTSMLSQSVGKRLVILGNLPYNISSPLLFRLVKAAPCLKHAVFMVQKEVGERLLANPGTKSYGVLSVLLGACARVSRLFEVGAAQFYPPPRVDSLVVRIDFAEGRFTATNFSLLGAWSIALSSSAGKFC